MRNSRLFLKLLEAVLKTGNRMNDGTYRGGAQAFKLDTLLKLSDVKGVDGKTTLLHFVVQEIIRSEGIRAARASSVKSISSTKSEDFVEESNQDSSEYYRKLGLQVVLGVPTELEDVKKAAVIDADSISSTLTKFASSIESTKALLSNELKDVECDFCRTLSSFVESVEGDVKSLMAEEKRILALVKSTGDYFHGHAGKDEGLRLFSIVREFLKMLEKSCREVKEAQEQEQRDAKEAQAQNDAASTDKKEATTASNSDKKEVSVASNPDKDDASIASDPDKNEAGTASNSSVSHPQPEVRNRLFPAIAARRVDDPDSDDENP